MSGLRGTKKQVHARSFLIQQARKLPYAEFDARYKAIQSMPGDECYREMIGVLGAMPDGDRDEYLSRLHGNRQRSLRKALKLQVPA